MTKVARQLQVALEQGTEQHVAWNNNMVSLICAAKVLISHDTVISYLGYKPLSDLCQPKLFCPNFQH